MEIMFNVYEVWIKESLKYLFVYSKSFWDFYRKKQSKLIQQIFKSMKFDPLIKESNN